MSSAAASTHPAEPPAARVLSHRLISLDAFRGATIAGMILVNNLGDHSTAYSPLTHETWNGWTMTDLVFPFFLWIMGVAMAYSAASRHARGEKPEVFLRHVFTRAGALFAIGLFLNAFPAFDFPHLRIMGVLQRIALCYLFASLIQFYSGTRGLILWSAGLLTSYWLLMTLYPVPGFGPGVLEQQGNFAQYIDSLVLKGHLYKNQLMWDPEGLVSTLTSIVNTLLGILCGGILRSHEDEDSTKLRSMVVYGTALVAIGLLCDRWLPINKNLWTSSYAMFTSGLAFLAMAATWWIVDVQGVKRPAWFFLVFGVNAIAVYTASSILADIMSITGWKKALYEGFFLSIATPINASALYGLANVAALFVLAYVLYRKQIFVKL
jgi:predicted acyltransferase